MTRAIRWDRTATSTPTSARAIGKRLAVLLGHRAFRDLPAILETPGRDGKGPDALEMRRLRRLCREAGIPIGEAGRA
jgi:hypothetical protein